MFHSLAIINKAAMTIHAQFLSERKYPSLGQRRKSAIAGSRGN